MSTNNLQKMTPFCDIFEEHVDEAAFLWMLRSSSVSQSQTTQQKLAKLESRLHKHLAGLQVSPDDAWFFCSEAIERFEQIGEAFVMAVIAFESKTTSKIQIAIERGMSNAETFKGLTAAFGWLPADISQHWIKRLLASNVLEHQHLAIAACSIRRNNPGEALEKILTQCQEHKPLYTRALRLVGELKRHDLLSTLEPIVNQASRADNADDIFWASWSSVLLGQHAALTPLKNTVMTNGKHQSRAIELAFSALPIPQAQQWIEELAQDTQQICHVIQAVAVLGNSHAIDWLIEQMEDATLSRQAGEAFTRITGVDLEQQQLIQKRTQDKSDDENPDENDNDLLWPDREKIADFWQQIHPQFSPGHRYFLGQPLETAHLTTVLQRGIQGHRQAAAMALALHNPEHAYVNTEAIIPRVIQ